MRLRPEPSLPTGLQCHAYGTAVPCLRDCSAIPTGLQFHPHGTAASPTREKDRPAAWHLGRGVFFLVVKLKCVTSAYSLTICWGVSREFATVGDPEEVAKDTERSHLGASSRSTDDEGEVAIALGVDLEAGVRTTDRAEGTVSGKTSEAAGEVGSVGTIPDS